MKFPQQNFLPVKIQKQNLKFWFFSWCILILKASTSLSTQASRTVDSTVQHIPNRLTKYAWDSQVAVVLKNPPVNAEDARDLGSIPGSGRSPEGGNGKPLQYSCLEKPIDRGAWWATVHRSQRVRHDRSNLALALTNHADQLVFSCTIWKPEFLHGPKISYQSPLTIIASTEHLLGSRPWAVEMWNTFAQP